jgi:hypothetical protein
MSSSRLVAQLAVEEALFVRAIGQVSSDG